MAIEPGGPDPIQMNNQRWAFSLGSLRSSERDSRRRCDVRTIEVPPKPARLHIRPESAAMRCEVGTSMS